MMESTKIEELGIFQESHPPYKVHFTLKLGTLRSPFEVNDHNYHFTQLNSS